MSVIIFNISKYNFYFEYQCSLLNFDPRSLDCIDSPRSLYACKRLGIDNSETRILSMEQVKDMFPSTDEK